ncbi:MAG: hypothetical protein AAGC81_19825, partial [Pseudomonadota bacterium]
RQVFACSPWYRKFIISNNSKLHEKASAYRTACQQAGAASLQDRDPHKAVIRSNAMNGSFVPQS